MKLTPFNAPFPPFDIFETKAFLPVAVGELPKVATTTGSFLEAYVIPYDSSFNYRSNILIS
jgi:hypothetical protein